MADISLLTKQFEEYVETTEREIREANTPESIKEAQDSIKMHVDAIKESLEDAKKPENDFSAEELKEIETAATEALGKLKNLEKTLQKNKALIELKAMVMSSGTEKKAEPEIETAIEKQRRAEILEDLEEMVRSLGPANPLPTQTAKEATTKELKSPLEKNQQQPLQQYFYDALETVEKIAKLNPIEINTAPTKYGYALAQAQVCKDSPAIAQHISQSERDKLNRAYDEAVEHLDKKKINLTVDKKAPQKNLNTIVINTWINQLLSLEGPTAAEQAKKIVSSHTHSGVSTKMINQNIVAVKTALRTYEKDPSDKNLAEANAKIDSFLQSTVVKLKTRAEQTDPSESAQADTERMRQNIQILNYISRDINPKSAPSISAADAMKRLESIQTELQTLQQTVPSEPEDMANHYLALNKLLVEATELKKNIPEKETSIGLKNIRDGASECIGDANKNIHALVQKVRSLDYYHKVSPSEFQKVADRASSQKVGDIEIRNELVKSYLCYQSGHDDHILMRNTAHHDQEFIKVLAHLDALPPPAPPEFPDDMPPPSLDSTESLASTTPEIATGQENLETAEHEGSLHEQEQQASETSVSESTQTTQEPKTELKSPEAQALDEKLGLLKQRLAQIVVKEKVVNVEDLTQVINSYKKLTAAYSEAHEIVESFSRTPDVSENTRAGTKTAVGTINLLTQTLNETIKKQYGIGNKETARMNFFAAADTALAANAEDQPAAYKTLVSKYMQYKASIAVDERMRFIPKQEETALTTYRRDYKIQNQKQNSKIPESLLSVDSIMENVFSAIEIEFDIEIETPIIENETSPESIQEILDNVLENRQPAAEPATPPAPPSRPTSVVMDLPTRSSVSPRASQKLDTINWDAFWENCQAQKNTTEDSVSIYANTARELNFSLQYENTFKQIHDFALTKGAENSDDYKKAFASAYNVWNELDLNVNKYLRNFPVLAESENIAKLSDVLTQKGMNTEEVKKYTNAIETLAGFAKGIDAQQSKTKDPLATAEWINNYVEKNPHINVKLLEVAELSPKWTEKDWTGEFGTFVGHELIKPVQWLPKYKLHAEIMQKNTVGLNEKLEKLKSQGVALNETQRRLENIKNLAVLEGGASGSVSRSTVPTNDVNVAIQKAQDALIKNYETPNNNTEKAALDATEEAINLQIQKLHNRASSNELNKQQTADTQQMLGNLQTLLSFYQKFNNGELPESVLTEEAKKDIEKLSGSAPEGKKVSETINAYKKPAAASPVVSNAADAREHFSRLLTDIMTEANTWVPTKDHHGIDVVPLSRKQNPNLPVGTSGTIEVRYITEGQNNLIHTSDFERRVKYFCDVAKGMNPEKTAAIDEIKEKYIEEVRTTCNVDAIDLRAEDNSEKFAPIHKNLKTLYQTLQEELITEIKDPKAPNKDAKEKFEQAGKDYIRDRGRPIFVNVVKGSDGQVKYVNAHIPKGEKTYASHDRRRIELGVNPNAFFDVYAVPHGDKYEAKSVTSRAVSYSNFNRDDRYKNAWRNFKTVEADLSAVAAPIVANAKAGETIEVNFDSLSLLSPYMTALEKGAQAFKKTKGAVHDEEAPQVRDHARALAMNNGRTIQVKNAKGEFVNVKLNILHLNVATSINGIAKKTDLTYKEMLAAQGRINARSFPNFCTRQEESLHNLLPVTAFKPDNTLVKKWDIAQNTYKEACDKYGKALETYYNNPSQENAENCKKCEQVVKNTRRSLTAVGEDMVSARKEYWEANQEQWGQAVDKAKTSLKDNSLDSATQDKLKQFIYYANAQQQFFTEDYHTAEKAYLLANSVHRASELAGDMVAINCKSNNDRSGVKQQFLIAAHEHEKTGELLLPNDESTDKFLAENLGNICEYSSGLNAIDASRPGTWGNRCKKPDQFVGAKIGNKISGLSKVAPFPGGIKEFIKTKLHDATEYVQETAKSLLSTIAKKFQNSTSSKEAAKKAFAEIKNPALKKVILEKIDSASGDIGQPKNLSEVCDQINNLFPEGAIVKENKFDEKYNKFLEITKNTPLLSNMEDEFKAALVTHNLDIKQRPAAQKIIEEQNALLNEVRSKVAEIEKEVESTEAKKNPQVLAEAYNKLNLQEETLIKQREDLENEKKILEAMSKEKNIINKTKEKIKEQVETKKPSPAPEKFSILPTVALKDLVDEKILVAEIKEGELARFIPAKISLKDNGALSTCATITVEQSGISCKIPAHYANDEAIKNAMVKRAVIEALVAYPNGTQFKINGDPELQKAAEKLIADHSSGKAVIPEVQDRKIKEMSAPKTGPDAPQTNENVNLDEPVTKNRFPIGKTT